jgi:hypothetical protein
VGSSVTGEGQGMAPWAVEALLRQAAISAGLKNLIFVIALCVGVVLMAAFDQIVSGLIMEYGSD